MMPAGMLVRNCHADGMRLHVVLVAEGLDEPTDLAPAPDGRLFIAERRGRIRIFRDAVLQRTPAVTLADDHLGNDIVTTSFTSADFADKNVGQDKPISVRDISIGGLGVMLLPKADEPPKAISGERLRLSLRYREYEELVLEGRMRYMPPAGSPTPIRCGIQFKKLENNLEGRQALAALTRIVGELQREEVRRTRLGIKVA